MEGAPASRSSAASRAAEAVGAGAAGAVLAGATWSLIGLGLPAAVVGAVNGSIAGARRIYGWRSVKGPVAFVLDSTWGLPMSMAAIVPHLVALAQRGRAGYVPELSERADRHVYMRGFKFRPKFAITIGNVVNQAGDVRRSPRRVKLVTDHENVHVWQARWFGPFYPLLYLGWTIAGGAAGAVLWLVHRRDAPFAKVVESCSYYCNPFEWWAYSRDAHWPPSGMVARVGWRLPAVQSFTARAARRSAGK